MGYYKSKWFKFDENISFKLRYISLKELEELKKKSYDNSLMNLFVFYLELFDRIVEDYIKFGIHKLSKHDKMLMMVFNKNYSKFCIDKSTDKVNFNSKNKKKNG